MSKSAGIQKQWRRVASTHDLEELLEGEGQEKPRNRVLLFVQGFALAAVSGGFLVYEFYALMLPDVFASQDSWIRKDRYYCLLIPLLITTLLYTIAVNWFAAKIFKHNS